MTLVSDAIPVVQHVSGVLVVARMGLVTRSMARHAAQQLENLRAPILGVVANAIPTRDHDYYYGYGYEYGSNGAGKKASGIRSREIEPNVERRAPTRRVGPR
jgi:Mrp family chromosome partitioning ATPase